METTSQPKRPRWYLAILLIATVIISAQLIGFAYFQTRNRGTSGSGVGPVGPGSSGSSKTGKNNSTGTGPIYLTVSTLVNYGNSTSDWYNETKIPPGWNFYNLTVFLANGNVKSQYYQSYKEHYILAINGLAQNSASYWSLWTFCQKDWAWAYSSVGADDIQLSDGQILAWYFQSYSNNGPPVARAPTVLSCSA